MEIRVFGLVLLLVMCAALPAESQSWEEFRQKHIYPSMDERGCTDMINNRNVVNPDGTCKPINSFILATEDQVIAVCHKGGRPVSWNVRESNSGFLVVHCSLNVGSNPCTYANEKPTLRYITITCEKGLPVHYKGDRDLVN
ncbi:hypothetical protein AMELA_G00257670 [Ameiurus melas]|uniref:Ribonuclease A-domain domain-containing protein n=1 Tax=Ameiurus melas TaxID=219545 RepID=A0A7J5ZS92_AMEME|nr:hypothetical protein AMELA_G00257670 [Ameiurus melas]